MSEGISAARTSASLFCIFYILFLLFILVPFLFSSWFISPPPVLFLPEEQHYPLLSLCTIFYFFFPLHTAPLLAGFHTLCGSWACRRRTAAGLPSNVSASYHRSSTSAAPGEESVAGEEVEEAGVGETWSISEARVHPGFRAWELHLAALLGAAVEWSGVWGQMGAEKEERLLAESKFPLVPPRRNKGTCLVRLKGSEKPFWEVGHAPLGEVPGAACGEIPQGLKAAWNSGRKMVGKLHACCCKAVLCPNLSGEVEEQW